MFSFDPTCGYDRGMLLQVGLPDTEPGDFQSFWENSRAETLSVPTREESIANPSPSPRHFFEKLFFDTLGGIRVGAWLATPVSRRPKAVIVYAHGYGEIKTPFPDQPDVCQCWISAPGIALSAQTPLPGAADQHVLHGIKSRETYLIRNCAAALWSAAEVLTRRFPHLQEKLFYHGVSFSAGLGALALPWEPRYRRAVLELPTFGHHPLRFQHRSLGSAEVVRNYRESHPEVDSVLAYFDAATAASYLRTPVLAAPALFDPVVPPPGQFGVVNALREPSDIFVFQAGHWEHPGSMAERKSFQVRVRDWFGLVE